MIDHAAPIDDAPAALLEARGLVKRFGAVTALDAVDFSLRPGEVHALMGENGAGKSTLVKCLSGVHAPDAGSLLLHARPIAPASPRHAESLGISTVFQEVNLIPHMSVAENISVGREPIRPLLFRKIRWREVRDRARAALRRLGVDIDVSRELASCSIALQQLTAIARALDVNARALILDEPTSSLDQDEVRQLFGVMTRLRRQGMGIIFITHFLDQVYAVADRITILRDGRLVGVYNAADLPRNQLVGLMVGRELESTLEQTASHVEHDAQTPASAPPVARAVAIGRRGALRSVDLAVGRSESVGLVGLLGSGRTETARLLFGADTLDRGRIEIDGAPVRLRSPRHAIRHGVALTPEDRRRDGIIPNLSVRENIILALQARRGIARPIPRAKQLEIADRYIRLLGIKTPDSETPIARLSGGNQQKALLARWLLTDPRLLILDEPTRGIDVGAKAEILRVTEELREKGMGILFISSELDEVVRACRRLVVLRDRRSIAELSGPDRTEQNVLAAIAAPDPTDTPSHLSPAVPPA